MRRFYQQKEQKTEKEEEKNSTKPEYKEVIQRKCGHFLYMSSSNQTNSFSYWPTNLAKILSCLYTIKITFKGLFFIFIIFL